MIKKNETIKTHHHRYTIFFPKITCVKNSDTKTKKCAGKSGIRVPNRNMLTLYCESQTHCVSLDI